MSTVQAPQRIIDLSSDTATLPTLEMLAAAERVVREGRLGDEQRGADPTTAALEARVAAMIGTERAMLVPSATMANQIALALHCQPGGEVIAHESAHVIHYEGGGTALIARAQPRALSTPRGIFGADDVAAVLREADPHHPPTGCVVIENTSNGGGGSVWPTSTLQSVTELCRDRGVAVHIDGARLWNASIKSGLSLQTLCTGATTVQLCFSKGLGCPTGAILGLPDRLWPMARRLKQALGGAMRQSGVLAAMMDHALDHHLQDLAVDHARAARIGDVLRRAGVDVEPVETNLVFCHPDPGLLQRLDAAHVRSAQVSRSVSPKHHRLRLCTHRSLTDDDINVVCAAILG